MVEMKKTIVTIKRTDYKSPNSKITIECEGIKIDFYPDRLQKYDITDLLHGGKQEVQLPCDLDVKEND
jgi:hypothetical protein